jgi:putative ABC transport system permease protein
MKLLTRASVRHLTRHRLQSVLSVLGVALGVAVVLSIDLAISSARTGFQISAETVAGRATHVVVSESGTLDESLIRVLRVDLGLEAVAPVVEGYASSTEVPGRALRVLGIDPFSESPFRPWVAGGATGVDVSGLITTRLGVVVSDGLARTAGVNVGDSLAVRASGDVWSAPVVAVVEPLDDVARAGLADVLLMDISSAQEILRTGPRLSRIELRLASESELADVRAALTEYLPGGTRVELAGTRAETMSGMIAAFDVNLTALSLLGLIFGMFLIYNSVTFSVVQRRDTLSRLRAIGVTRAEVMRLILSEAVWIGCAGAALGVLLGVFLAEGLVGMIAATINDLYFAVAVRSVDLEPTLVAKAAGLGLASTLLASIPPALEAADANPRLSGLRSVIESRARSMVPRAAAAGVALTALGGVLLVLPTRSLLVSFSSLFFVITGLAAMTPAGTLLVVRVVYPALRATSGTLGSMAARGVGSSLSRTAPAIAALVVAVSVTVGLGVMIESFRGTLTRWLETTLQADVYVSLPGPGASRASGTLWPEMIDAFVGHPQVVGHSTYRGTQIIRKEDVFQLVALDLDPLGESAFTFAGGRSAEVMAAFRSGDGVIVSEPFAYRRGLAEGDHVELSGEVGTRAFPIVGIFRDYGSEQGTVMLTRALYDQLYDDDGVTSLGLFLKEGADSEVVVAELMSLVPEGRTVVARTNDTLRRASLEVFERTFRITGVLRLLAFIVAFVGVLSALASLQLERARELGLLRAAGLTPGQLWRLVITQTGLIGLASGLLAVPMGLVLSLVMVFVVNKRSFGWSLDFQIGPTVLAQAVGLAVAAALLAGIYPAWRMARTSPALALRGE